MLVQTLSWALLAWGAAHASAVLVSTPAAQYDYIIVGGGTAGTALATRLSQSLPRHTILLIEAGPAQLDNDDINVPGRKGSTLSGPLDWNFTTTPQPGTNDRVMPVNRGKVLGGSSALNLMTWDRSSEVEYDAWERLGNPGWNFTTMMTAMLRAENFTRNENVYGEDGMGDAGPVRTVINGAIPAQQRDTWIPTMQALGLEHNLESLDGNPLGVMDQPSNVDAGTGTGTRYTRSYSANAYLPLAGSNLHVLTDTRVARVNIVAAASPNSTFDSRNLTATGVTLVEPIHVSDTTNTTTTHLTKTLHARREVILSAGSIQSPGLLEHSGIGNATILAAAGVPLLLELPGVGENLQDHPRVQVSRVLKKDTYRSFDQLRYNTTFAAAQMALWRAGMSSAYDYTGSGYAYLNWAQLFNATGDSSTCSGDANSTQAKKYADLLALAHHVADNSTVPASQVRLAHLSDARVPQVEVIFSDGYTGFGGYPAAPTTFTTTNTNTSLYGRDMFTLIGILMQPFSRGSVHINTTTSTTPPVINPNYLSNAYDVSGLVTLAKFLRRIGHASPMRDIWEMEYEPGLATVPNDDNNDEEWEAYVRSTVLSIYHPVGTCAMLPRADGGVVDLELKVYGVNGLRVVDASIMPVLLSAHVQTAVYGIAERAAGMIARGVKRKGGRRGRCGRVSKYRRQVV